MDEGLTGNEKWHFLKVVSDMDELDRVRRQHQMQPHTEDDQCIIFKCRGSALCPYSMAFYRDRNTIYIRHAHDHDTIVPIAGRWSDGHMGGGRLFTQQATAGAIGDQAQQKRNAEKKKKKASRGRGGRELAVSTVPCCSTTDEEEGDDKEEEEKEEEDGEGGMEEDGKENDGGWTMTTRGGKMGVEVGGDEQEKKQGGQVVPKLMDQANNGTGRGRANDAQEHWRSLGKVAGDIGEVCHEVCKVHFVRKSCPAKKGKLFFKCPRGKCKYRTMITLDERVLYCHASHNHSVEVDPAAAPSSSDSSSALATTHSVRPLFSSSSASSASSSSSALSSATATTGAAVYRDNSGNEWLLLASRVFSVGAIRRLCRVHSLRQPIVRHTTTHVYLRCARFGSACPYRVTWHRTKGRVYHRQGHDHAQLLLLNNDDNNNNNANNNRRPTQHHHQHHQQYQKCHADAVAIVDKMQSDRTSAPGTPPWFLDKLGRKWTFLTTLDAIGTSSNRTSRNTTIQTPTKTTPLDQQLDQLCAERHLSRSRLSSNSTRVWLHCAARQQQRHLAACPYRAVVHLPECAVFHRFWHNHPVPNEDADKEGDAQNGGNANAKHRNNSRRAPSATKASPAPISGRGGGPETRSKTTNGGGTTDRRGATAGNKRPNRRQAFVRARAKMTGHCRGEEEEDEKDDDEEEEQQQEEDDEDGSATEEEDVGDGEDSDQQQSVHRPSLCKTWPRTNDVRVKRGAFVKARASIANGAQAEQATQTEHVPSPPPPSTNNVGTNNPSLTPPTYKFSNKNWHFLADQIWDKKALTEFCKANMLRIAGGIITNTYRNRLLCVRSGCLFRALWLNRQGLVYGLRKHNHSLTPKIRPVEKEEKEEPNEPLWKLADLMMEFESLAEHYSLHFRIDNDVFMLMLRAEVGHPWLSRLLMLRDDEHSVRVAEFTGCREEFSEKAEHWLKTDFEGRHQLMSALHAKCKEYFQAVAE